MSREEQSRAVHPLLTIILGSTAIHLFTQLQSISWKTDPTSIPRKAIDLHECFGKCSSPSFCDKDVNAICSVIAHSPWFKVVLAHDMNLSALSTKVLFASIANRQLVDKIVLTKMGINASKIGEVIAIGGNVKYLDLSQNKLGDLGIEKLARAFVPEEYDDDDYTCALTDLKLNKCSIVAAEGFNTLCTNVLANTMASSLLNIDFSSNSLGGKGSEAIALFLGLSQTLKVLRCR